ncbi:MAG: hypothetical protein KDB23_01955 [Planctomycetales bacterium]|nr:hypothetical protein [Planctomycetales bacterium]
MQLRSSERSILAYLRQHKLIAACMVLTVERKSVLKTLRRMQRKGRVSQWRHASGLEYWTVAADRPLSNGSVAATYGRWLFCEGPNSSTRSLLCTQDVADYFPALARSGMPAGYYIERFHDRARVGLVKVDRLSRVNRIVSTTFRVIDQHRRRSEFRRLIEHGQFELTWLVATAEKTRRLNAALAATSTSEVPVHVSYVPDLLDLLLPLTAAD